MVGDHPQMHPEPKKYFYDDDETCDESDDEDQSVAGRIKYKLKVAMEIQAELLTTQRA